MDLAQYRLTDQEQLRTGDLLRLMPATGAKALDIGARDGHFSVLMAERFDLVTALDLEQPSIAHERVTCVKGNAAKLDFADEEFDFVFCAEVLEHIPVDVLSKVCREIERVSSDRILIGVPYRQDIRIGRTTCGTCGGVNPPWGHVSSFDEHKIQMLFQNSKIEEISFVGQTVERTNSVSAALMNYAGNPFGTYDQEEGCIHCGCKLVAPPERTLIQRIATRCSVWARRASELFGNPRGNWIHVVLRK